MKKFLVLVLAMILLLCACAAEETPEPVLPEEPALTEPEKEKEPALDEPEILFPKELKDEEKEQAKLAAEQFFVGVDAEDQEKINVDLEELTALMEASYLYTF